MKQKLNLKAFQAPSEAQNVNKNLFKVVFSGDVLAHVFGCEAWNIYIEAAETWR